MKTLIVALLISFSSLLSISVTAAPLGVMGEKNSKLIRMVDNAHRDDWQTLNLAASLSINWNADLELAKQWLEASLKIQDSPETYEILGDYYLRRGDIKKAYEHYFIAYDKGMFTLSDEVRSRIQMKLYRFGDEC